MRIDFDSFGRVTNKADNLHSNLFVYSYDGIDRLTNRWTPEKGNTAYAYSAVGNLTNISYPVSPDVSFGWDAMNRCTNMVDGVGTTAYSYDAAGQVLTEDGPFASDTVTNAYSNRQRVGLALAQPSGYWTNGFLYDPAKRLTNVAMSAGNFSYQYSAIQNRLVTNLGLPNTSVITNGYDANARLLLTSLNNSSGTPLDSYAYIYDPANERTNVTRADSSAVAFKYDKIGQLTVADSSVNTEDRGYFYDAAWNLNRRTNNGVSSTFTVESRNELTNAAASPITYDFNGNLITYVSPHYIYTYDDENRLIYWTHYAVSALSPSDGDLQTAFVYDGRGRLRERFEYRMTCNANNGTGPQSGPGNTNCDWILQSETIYIYDANRVIQERNGTNNLPLVTYTRGIDLSGTFEGAGGIGGLLARSSGYSSVNGSWSTHNYYHGDGNGNITALVGNSQTLAASYRYDPFGSLISSSGSLASANVYRFSSKEFMINSGMYYYLYRFYDPNLQRWVNRDPITDRGFTILTRRPSPRGTSIANSFCFVENRPISDFDGLGLLIYYCTVQTSGFPLYGVGNHGYLWDDRPGLTDQQRECGMEGSCGSSGNTSGNTGPGGSKPMAPGTVCTPVDGSAGKEPAIMSYCATHANTGLWVPGINDCHTSAQKCLSKNNVTPPPIRNGVFDNPGRAKEQRYWPGGGIQ